MRLKSCQGSRGGATSEPEDIMCHRARETVAQAWGRERGQQGRGTRRIGVSLEAR